MSDDQKKQAFKSDLGHKAVVKRDDIKGDLVEQCNMNLRRVGNDMTPLLNEQTGRDYQYEYVGSAAVHIYKAGEIFKTLNYISQTSTLNQVPETVASTAIMDLAKNAEAFYRGRAKKLRSGF